MLLASPPSKASPQPSSSYSFNQGHVDPSSDPPSATSDGPPRYCLPPPDTHQGGREEEAVRVEELLLRRWVAVAHG